ncbi:MAG: NAD(P)/FAD-dependent oxidoreductase [Erysipelotrichaceae bacterium]
MYDIIVIGAGVIGSFIARDLAKYQLRIAVLEQEHDVGNGVSMANSAIIHAGHDPKAGSLKARFNVEGNALYPQYAKELAFACKPCGGFVVAHDQAGVERLEAMLQVCEQRNIPASILQRVEAIALEPNLADTVVAVLNLPTTKIVYPWEVCIALMENAVDNGVELFLDHRVSAITKEAHGYTLQCEQGAFHTKKIINAAGLYADEIARMIDPQFETIITPRKGEYFVLDHAKKMHVNRVLYPLPTQLGKGILVTPTVSTNLLLGPNSTFVDDKEDLGTTSEQLAHIAQEVKRTVKDLPMDTVVRTFAGLRPTSTHQDFMVTSMPNHPDVILALGIESPGLASAPAIGRYVVEELLACDANYPKNPAFQPKRRGFLNLKSMSQEERDALVSKDPSFAQMVCRCEQVSEAEIVDVIKRSVGARSVKGVKKRVRPGMGRCQGGFCEPLVVAILAKTLGIKVEEVVYDRATTYILQEKSSKGEQR